MVHITILLVCNVWEDGVQETHSVILKFLLFDYLKRIHDDLTDSLFISDSYAVSKHLLLQRCWADGAAHVIFGAIKFLFRL